MTTAEIPEPTELQDLAVLIRDDWRAMAYGDGPDGWEHVAEEEIDSGRWFTYMRTIHKGPSGQLYAWDWSRGLTEVQDNECDSPAPHPVKAITKTVIVTEYVPTEN